MKMTKILTQAVLTVAIILCLSPGVMAQQGDLFDIIEKGGTSKDTPLSIQVSPVEIFRAFPAGTKNRVEIKITNSSRNFINILAEPMGMSYDTKSNALVTSPILQTKESDLARHIKANPESFTLPPNSTKSVNVIVETIPGMKGTQMAAVSFGGGQAKEKAIDDSARKAGKTIARVGISPAATARFFVNISGVTNFKYEWLAEKTSFGKGSLQSEVQIRNTGDGILRPQLKVSVFDKNTSQNIATLRRISPKKVYPGSGATITTESMSKSLPPGNYSIVYTLSDADGMFPEETRELNK